MYNAAFRSWLSGIADGESTFTIQRYRKAATHAMTVRFCWSISLRADDVDVIRLIQGYTGGGLCKTGHSQGNPKWVLQVTRREEHFRLIQHFRKYPLRSKKRREFELWAEAIELWDSATGKPKPKEVHDKVEQIAEEIRAYRVFFDPDA